MIGLNSSTHFDASTMYNVHNVLFTLNHTTHSSKTLLRVVRFNVNKTLVHLVFTFFTVFSVSEFYADKLYQVSNQSTLTQNGALFQKLF